MQAGAGRPPRNRNDDHTEPDYGFTVSDYTTSGNPEAVAFLTPDVTRHAANMQIKGAGQRAKKCCSIGGRPRLRKPGGSLFTYASVESLSEFNLVSGMFTGTPQRRRLQVLTTNSGTNRYRAPCANWIIR